MAQLRQVWAGISVERSSESILTVPCRQPLARGLAYYYNSEAQRPEASSSPTLSSARGANHDFTASRMSRPAQVSTTLACAGGGACQAEQRSNPGLPVARRRRRIGVRVSRQQTRTRRAAVTPKAPSRSPTPQADTDSLLHLVSWEVLLCCYITLSNVILAVKVGYITKIYCYITWHFLSYAALAYNIHCTAGRKTGFRGLDLRLG